MPQDNINIRSSGQQNETLKKFLDFKIRNSFEDLPNAPYQKPLIFDLIRVINQVTLFLGLFGILWFSMMYAYTSLPIYFFILMFTIFTLIMLAIGWLTLEGKVKIENMFILFGLMLLSSMFYFLQVLV